MPKLRKYKNLIDTKLVPNAIRQIVRQLREKGYDAKLVGGCVRDILLNLTPKDFDVVTTATPLQVRRLFKNARIIGKRFRIVHVMSDIGIVEISTYRKSTRESTDPAVPSKSVIRSPRQAGTMKLDYVLRDFTVNALFFDIERNIVYDFVGGLNDLRNRKLRCIGDPINRFTDDCHRILRAIRFLSKLDFNLTNQLDQALRSHRDLLSYLEPSRLSYDLEKMLLHGYAHKLCTNLFQFEFLPYIFPDVDIEDPLSQLALTNTDARVAVGKPVRMAFLLSAFYWPHYREANITNDREAEIELAKRVLEGPCENVSLRAETKLFVIETWRLQAKLEQRPLRNGKQILLRKRFRAAYDLLSLRAQVGQASLELVDWWTKIQEVSAEEQEQMLKAVAPPRKRRPRRRKRSRKTKTQVAVAS